MADVPSCSELPLTKGRFENIAVFLYQGILHFISSIRGGARKGARMWCLDGGLNWWEDFLGTRRTEIFKTDPTESNVLESYHQLINCSNEYKTLIFVKEAKIYLGRQYKAIKTGLQSKFSQLKVLSYTCKIYYKHKSKRRDKNMFFSLVWHVNS